MQRSHVEGGWPGLGYGSQSHVLESVLFSSQPFLGVVTKVLPSFPLP